MGVADGKLGQIGQAAAWREYPAVERGKDLGGIVSGSVSERA